MTLTIPIDWFEIGLIKMKLIEDDIDGLGQCKGLIWKGLIWLKLTDTTLMNFDNVVDWFDTDWKDKVLMNFDNVVDWFDRDW